MSEAEQSPFIVNATADTFEHDVFEKSCETTIVVDFWAAWCAPCRMLAPILEGLANEFEGKFTLVKANTEELPAAVAKFGVQGIPAVYGVINGEIVDFFTGVLPEQNIREWLNQLFAANALVEARRLEEANPAAAAAEYRALVEQSPNDANPKIGLARALLAQEKLDDCREVVDELEKRGFLEPEAESVKAALELGDWKGKDVGQLREQVSNEPGNLEVQLRLAEALAGAKQYEEALEACLVIVQQDRKGIGDNARQIMLNIFSVLPDDSELTTIYRRKLSMALY